MHRIDTFWPRLVSKLLHSLPSLKQKGGYNERVAPKIIAKAVSHLYGKGFFLTSDHLGKWLLWEPTCTSNSVCHGVPSSLLPHRLDLPQVWKAPGTCLLLEEQREFMTFSSVQWRVLSPLSHRASPCVLVYDIMLTENSVVVLRWGRCVVYSALGFTLLQALALISTLYPTRPRGTRHGPWRLI